MHQKRTVAILILTFLSHLVCAEKILGIFMGLGRDHYVLGKSFMVNLVETGHDCVLISRYCDEKNNAPRYKEIIVRDDENSDALFEATQQDSHNPFFALNRIYGTTKRIIPKVFEDTQVKKLLNETFDLVVIEEVFADALKVLAWHFKAKLIVFHPHRANFWVNSIMGNPSFPSYTSEYPSALGVDMNFLERLENVALYIYGLLFKQFVNLKEHNELKDRYFPGSPDLSDIIYNISLAFLNSDVSVHQSVPKLQNMIDIGGFHITPSKALPDDVLAFLNKSKKGVVYVDLKFLTSSFMSEETLTWIVKVFSEFEHDFIWLWDEDNVPNQPPNLLIRDSLVQGAVLAHPNIKLFIHVGDTADIIESVYYGVPQLFIPILDDQLYGTAQGQYFGYSKTLPLPTLNEKDFRWALQKLLNDTKYSQEAQERSKILKQKLISPKATQVYWVNFVLKTNGTTYMRSTSLDYSWYQLWNIDIIGIFIGLIIFVIILFMTLIVQIYRKCCRCSKKRSKTKSYNSLTSIAE